jgi:hypothetical protein
MDCRRNTTPTSPPAAYKDNFTRYSAEMADGVRGDDSPITIANDGAFQGHEVLVASVAVEVCGKCRQCLAAANTRRSLAWVVAVLPDKALNDAGKACATKLSLVRARDVERHYDSTESIAVRPLRHWIGVRVEGSNNAEE